MIILQKKIFFKKIILYGQKGVSNLFLEQKSGDCLTKKNGEKNNNQLISQKPFFFPKHLFARMEPI